MLKMENQNDHFKKGKNATQARQKICDVYNKDAMSQRIIDQKWLAKFLFWW